MRAVCFIYIFLFGSLAFSQTPAYLHYGVEDGLPSSLVYCAIQDKKGFMWFGTNNGLARFDGTRFKVYGMKDGLPDPEVLNLFEDSQERLWISCFQKKPCYLRNGKIYNSENDSLLNNDELKGGHHSFYEDNNNRILISVDRKRVFCYCDGKVFNCYKNGLKQDYSFPYITEIDSELFVASYDGVFNITDIQSPRRLFKNKQDFAFLPTTRLLENAYYVLTGNIWTYVDLNKDDLIEKKQILSLPNQSNRITIWDDNHFWICYPHSLEGAFKIDIERPNKFGGITNYLNGRKVSCIFEDDKKNIWFTTLAEGIFNMPYKTAVTYNKYSSNIFTTDNITALALMPDNKLLIGNEVGQIYGLDNGRLEQFQFKKKLKQSKVRQIVKISENGWVAVLNIDIYAENNDLVEPRFKLNGHANPQKKIVAPKYILHDRNKTWIAHINGLSSLESNKKFLEQVIADKRFTTIGKDNENNIWAGGPEGLLSEKDSFQINWGNKFKTLSGRIIDIKPAAENHLWVATAENQLLKVQVEKGEVISVQVINDFLENKINGIKSLYKSEVGDIWLATNNGIYSLDDKLNIKHFDQMDGLPSNDVNALVIDQDTLWAATVAGLAKLQLDQEKCNGDFHTYISGLAYNMDGKVANIDLLNHPNDFISIPPEASMIDIQLSGLLYKNSGKLTFEYVEKELLLPLERLTWGNLAASLAQRISGKSDTIITNEGRRYFGANAPNGRFLTTVTAVSKDGIRSLHPDTKTLTILPKWYETIWFSLLIFSLIALVIWYIIRQWLAAKRSERVATEMQLQAIKAQINPHFIGNSINAIQQFFYPPDPAKASLYISNFTSLLRQTIHLSEVPFVPFHEELKYITDYLEMIKLRFGDRFEYRIENADQIPRSTLFPAMLLQPLLENATIHGLAPKGLSQLLVEFNFKKDQLVSTIKDNGVGIEASKAIKKAQKRKRVSKGIGLLQKKIEVLNKIYRLDINLDIQDLSAISKNHHGTMITLSFSPKIITHLKTRSS